MSDVSIVLAEAVVETVVAVCDTGTEEALFAEEEFAAVAEVHPPSARTSRPAAVSEVTRFSLFVLMVCCFLLYVSTLSRKYTATLKLP